MKAFKLKTSCSPSLSPEKKGREIKFENVMFETC